MTTALRPTSGIVFWRTRPPATGELSSRRDALFSLLDEPINHLDIPSRARFEEALANFKGTILAVVHDRYFLERFASDVWNVRDGKIEIL
ncbi:MAG: hypothetical protein MZV70_21730 [Desulfobacterales bacterium]|nr:hypothetical protein [Desulfobacterales bacterium]